MDLMHAGAGRQRLAWLNTQVSVMMGMGSMMIFAGALMLSRLKVSASPKDALPETYVFDARSCACGQSNEHCTEMIIILRSFHTLVCF